jgi:hypothetical protein
MKTIIDKLTKWNIENQAVTSCPLVFIGSAASALMFIPLPKSQSWAMTDTRNANGGCVPISF